MTSASNRGRSVLVVQPVCRSPSCSLIAAIDWPSDLAWCSWPNAAPCSWRLLLGAYGVGVNRKCCPAHRYGASADLSATRLVRGDRESISRRPCGTGPTHT